MTRTEDFDAFYLSTREQVLASSYALSGDVATAKAAIISGYARAWRHWEKVGDENPAGYVRDEASRTFGVARRRLTRKRRRRYNDADPALMRALNRLHFDQRRLVTLFTVAGLDLSQATAEMGIDEELAFEQTSVALDHLENELKVSIGELEARLAGLRKATLGVKLPSPEELRSGARRGGRRNAIAVAAAAIAALVVTSLLATNGSALAMLETPPQRQTFGSAEPELVFNARNLSLANLLSVQQVSSLDPAQHWKLQGTSTDTGAKTPYSTCPPERFADPDASAVYVAAYATDNGAERVAQSIEVSRSQEASTSAYTKLLSWYADCEHPRTRLIDAYTVQRPFGDFHILRLQSDRDPARFMTVGITQSGTVTNTLVWEVNGTTPTDVNKFVNVLNDSVSKVCKDSGGDCSPRAELQAAPVPPAPTDPSFLSAIDIPPLGKIDATWVAGPAAAPADGKNPSSSPCGESITSANGASSVQSRVILMPDATQLPSQFAVTQTTATFPSADAAAAAVSAVAANLDTCPQGKLNPQVDHRMQFSGEGYSGEAWQMTFELTAGQKVIYQMAVVQRGTLVTQVLVPPAGDASFTFDEALQIANRAGERLAYANVG